MRLEKPKLRKYFKCFSFFNVISAIELTLKDF